VTALARFATEVTERPPDVVVLSDWTPGDLVDLAARAHRDGTTVLPIRGDGALVLIGPLTGLGIAGCVACAERARIAGLTGTLPETDTIAMTGVVAPAALDLIDTLAREAIESMRPGVQWAVRCDDFTASEHPVRPFGGCEVCAPVPDDARWTLSMGSQPLPDPTVLRAANPRTDTATMRAVLVDWRQGPIRQLHRLEGAPMALVSAEVGDGHGRRQAGFGRGGDFLAAERVALFEALERVTGMAPRGRRSTVFGAYRDLAPGAVDPERLGLHDEQYYDHPAFDLVPYSPETPTQWVHGCALPDGRSVLVPEHVAYWHAPRSVGGHRVRMLYESSNGCGLGNSLAEAILYGLLEVAERDAFLMAWYAQTALPAIAVPTDDLDVADLADQLDALDHDLLLFDATNDFGIPVVISMTLRRTRDPDRPNALFAAGAHPDPRVAIRSAVAEVVLDARNAADSRIGRFEPERLRPMLENPTLVRTMDDHVAVNGLAEARDRYAFLLDSRESQAWHEIWPDRPWIPDLGHYLAETVRRLAAAGLDVIAVDQSESVSRELLGLHAAKVIVPGSLPMTFGEVYRRTRGLPRLLEVPAALGRASAALRYADLPLYPHPFP